MPIPAAGGTIAAIVYFFEKPVSDQMYAGIMVAVTFILAFLMVSTLRYNSLKGITLGKKSHFAVLVIAFLFILIFFLSRPTLLILAVGYAVSGPIIKVCGLLRRTKPGEGN
jgi:CDP-diacylglycerol--serine O-phosphatidyltransferase